MTQTIRAALGGAVLALASLAASAAEPLKIAFVDTGNTGRSVTAEALAGARIRELSLPLAVISRAVDADPFDDKPEPNAAALLLRRGLDVSAHRAVQISGNDTRHADLILTMTAKHKAKVVALYPDAAPKTFTLAEYAAGESHDIADAWGKPMAVYEQMFAEVDRYVPLALAKALLGKP